MSKRTLKQIEAAYKVASDVFDGKMPRRNGMQNLTKEHGMALGSAGGWIENFKLMIRGKKFHRAMSVDETEYCLNQIARRCRSDLVNAVFATQKHLDYYNAVARDKRKLIKEWMLKLTLDEFEEKVQQSIKEASDDSPVGRQARLANAEKYPKKIKVVAEVYDRSPDLVAEVLFLAQGKCGRCQNPAPFFRLTDGTPYLEVHHKIPLKDGGSDTIENAIALCPNCHRELHFGIPTSPSPSASSPPPPRPSTVADAPVSI